MKFEVLILGNSSATPIYERHPTSQIVNYNQQLFLIDCGEGTQMQLFRYGIKSNKIKHIFISHLHGDHYFGLIGLLSSMHLSGRKSSLNIYGPQGLKEILQIQFDYSDTVLRYELNFHVTDPSEKQVLLELPMLEVSSFPLTHRIPCTGFRFDEKQRARSLIKEKIEDLEIPIPYLSGIKKGLDYNDPSGRVYRNEELTLPAPKSRSYVYCSDTRKDVSYFSFIQEADLLYHETTFLHELQERAIETCHSTAHEAAEVAKEVGANRLLLGHYSARYKDLRPLLDEARSVFPSSQLSVEGRWYLV